MPEPGTGLGPRVAWLALLVLAVVGCRSTTRIGDHYYEKGRYPEAAAALETYLDTRPSDAESVARALYRLGVIYAVESSPAYDSARSIEVLETLLTEYPGSGYSAEAKLLRDLQVRMREMRLENAEERQRLQELQAELAARESRLTSLESEIATKDEEIAALKESIPPLRIEIRELIRQLAAKEEELEQLERLKAIDLGQPPP